VVVVFEDQVRTEHGEPYLNQGVQLIELVWGKAARIHTYVDTAKVARALDALAAHGVAEAHAAPISD
jgi:ketosteroid isomerase-like protein